LGIEVNHMLSTFEYRTPDENQNEGQGANQPIVLIAASGGGLTALREFFSAVPAETGVSFIVAQQLPSDHLDLLVDSLQSWAKPTVHLLKDDQEILPNEIYVVPTTSNAIVRDGEVRLLPVRSRWERHPALDELLVSLAESCPRQAVGVLLSGRGADGVEGLAQLEAAGGTVIVQDPQTANRAELPNAAIQATQDPWVLPPELIFSVVGALERGAPLERPRYESLDDIDPYLDPMDAAPTLQWVADRRF